MSRLICVVGVLHRSRGDSKLSTTRLRRTESCYIKRGQDFCCVGIILVSAVFGNLEILHSQPFAAAYMHEDKAGP
jgi:hypothetical protein